MQTVEQATSSGVSSAGAVSPDDLPLQRAYKWEREAAQAAFLTQPVAGRTLHWTWAQAMDETRRMAAYLSSQNWPTGSRIVILSKNCAWWIMAELAVWMSGHVTVPIYASLGPRSVRTLLAHCEPVACFVGAIEDKQVLVEGIPPGIQRITFPVVSDPSGLPWDGLVRTTAPMQASPVRAADDTATVIYTSGTTGAPKGAMHRFSSFVYFAAAAVRTIGEHFGGRMLPHLSLAHVAERALVEAVAYRNGAHLFFVESIDTFLTDLRRARPTALFSVPRVYLKIQQRVFEKVPRKTLDRWLRIPVVRTLAQRRILKQIGLDAVQVAASGGAPLPLSVLLWFRSIGLNLVEGYGMTETGITHTPPQGRSKPGYVGDCMPEVETRIAENGEVLVRSPMNMTGYYRNPEATAECFTPDGFFKTGDLGQVDDEGWLRILGRLKEQFKTSKGKYVFPSRIENLICASPLVEGCCVMGAGAAQPFAVVTQSEKGRELSTGSGGKRSAEEAFGEFLLQLNAQLEPHERLKFMVVTDQQWTVANGLLTPTMKLKRTLLESNYGALFKSWSNRNETIIWHVTA
jgi:long-chain acyl-CoA synthetase